MTTSSMKRPVAYIALTLLLLFLGLSALPAGLGFVLDPSGQSMGMSTATVRIDPFPNFLIPGLFLLLVLGLWSLIVVYGLWRRPAWSWLQALFNWSGCHWSWGAALLQGAILMAWIIIQVLLISLMSFLQPLFFIVGLAILGLCGLPAVRMYSTLDAA